MKITNLLKKLRVSNRNIVIFSLVITLVIRLILILRGSDSADITKLREMGEATLYGQNPYIAISYNIYPPIALFMEAITVYFTHLSNIPFHILSKIWPTFFDIAIGLLIYKFLTKQKVSAVSASIWTSFYLLNPITIILFSSHGQIDSIPTFLILLSSYVLTFKKFTYKFYLIGILLGIAIGIKPNPAMLIPVFIFYNLNLTKKVLFEKIIFLIVTFCIVFVSFIPFLLDGNFKIFFNLLSYSGVYDMGIAAMLRGLFYQQNASIWLPLAEKLIDTGKLTFLLGSIFVITIYFNSKKLLEFSLAVLLLFLGVYFGISAQYLSWVLPFAILLRNKIVILFSIFGTFALLGFYLFFGPEILFGALFEANIYKSKFMIVYFYGNALFYFTLVWWFCQLIQNHIKQNFKMYNRIHQKLIITTAIVFILSLLPYLYLIWKTLV